jgi:hypothetical protein
MKMKMKAVFDKLSFDTFLSTEPQGILAATP